MTKYLLAAFSILVVACVPTSRSYLTTNYRIGEEMSAPVGGEIVSVREATVLEQYGTVTGEQGMQHELLYGGVANDIVKVAYREYSVGGAGGTPGSAWARPAFAQDLQYDLNASKLITFRNIKIEVVSAANDKITYRVLDGPKPDRVTVKKAEPNEGRACERTTDCKSAALQCQKNVCVRWN